MLHLLVPLYPVLPPAAVAMTHRLLKLMVASKLIAGADASSEIPESLRRFMLNVLPDGNADRGSVPLMSAKSQPSAAPWIKPPPDSPPI